MQPMPKHQTSLGQSSFSPVEVNLKAALGCLKLPVKEQQPHHRAEDESCTETTHVHDDGQLVEELSEIATTVGHEDHDSLAFALSFITR